MVYVLNHQLMETPHFIAANRPIQRIAFLPFIFFLSACTSGSNDKVQTPPVTEQPTVSYNPYEKSEITVDVFMVDSLESNGSGGWGYDILINGKLYIHQPIIPGVQGNRVFSSEEKAREAGELVISKIRNNILPPSVSVEELDNRGLLE